MRGADHMIVKALEPGSCELVAAGIFRKKSRILRKKLPAVSPS
jgi:hypothetical protein